MTEIPAKRPQEKSLRPWKVGTEGSILTSAFPEATFLPDPRA